MYMYAVIKSNDMRVSNDSRGVQNHKKNINKIDTLRSSQNVCIWQYIEEKDYNVTSCEPQRDIKIYIQCKEARICKSYHCNVILKNVKNHARKPQHVRLVVKTDFFKMKNRQ